MPALLLLSNLPRIQYAGFRLCDVDFGPCLLSVSSEKPYLSLGQLWPRCAFRICRRKAFTARTDGRSPGTNPVSQSGHRPSAKPIARDGSRRGGASPAGGVVIGTPAPAAGEVAPTSSPRTPGECVSTKFVSSEAP